MDYYKGFAPQYDEAINWKRRFRKDLPFFRQFFTDNDVKSLLDCACGTGQHVIQFRNMGIDAKGSDASLSMVREARRNISEAGIETEVKVAEFRELGSTFNGQFDVVACLGNSLPHVQTDSGLVKSLEGMYEVLRNGGTLMVQQRNYDLLLKDQQRFIPISQKGSSQYFYVLDYQKGKIVFNIFEYDSRNKKVRACHKVPYFPLRKSKLERLLRHVGFRDLQVRHDFGNPDFDINKSTGLTVVCRK